MTWDLPWIWSNLLFILRWWSRSLRDSFKANIWLLGRCHNCGTGQSLPFSLGMLLSSPPLWSDASPLTWLSRLHPLLRDPSSSFLKVVFVDLSGSALNFLNYRKGEWKVKRAKHSDLPQTPNSGSRKKKSKLKDPWKDSLCLWHVMLPYTVRALSQKVLIYTPPPPSPLAHSSCSLNI